MVVPGSSRLPSSSEILEAVCTHANLPVSFASSLRLSRCGRPWDTSLDPEATDAVDWITADVAMRLRGGAPKKRCQHAKNSVTESQCGQPALRESDLTMICFESN